MKQYAVVTDHISGSTFGIIVRDEVSETCYGVSSKGAVWAEGYNELETKSLGDQLPYGVEIGEFRGMASFEEVLIEEIADGGQARLLDRSSMNYVGSKKSYRDASIVSLVSAPLRSFTNEKNAASAVEYKVRSFLNDSARSSIMVKARTERLGIDAETMAFKSREDDQLDEDLKQISMSSGMLRRTARDVYSAKSEVMFNHDGYDLNPFDVEEKKLGARIGGGLRAAPRGMSFVDITGRVDGDNDGIVFEGIPGMERPIIPRFMVPKNMARRVSALVDGDSMEIEKQRRSGNSTASIDQDRLNELLGDAAQFVKPIGGAQQGRRSARRAESRDFRDPAVQRALQERNQRRQERGPVESSRLQDRNDFPRFQRPTQTPPDDTRPRRPLQSEVLDEVFGDLPSRRDSGMRSRRSREPENFTDLENREIDSDYYRFDQGGEYSNSPKGRESDFISDKEQFEDDTFETNPDGWDWNSPETFEAFREWREDRDIRRGEEFDRRMADQETMPPGEYDRLLGERERSRLAEREQFGMRSQRRDDDDDFEDVPIADSEQFAGAKYYDQVNGENVEADVIALRDMSSDDVEGYGVVGRYRTDDTMSGADYFYGGPEEEFATVDEAVEFLERIERLGNEDIFYGTPEFDSRSEGMRSRRTRRASGRREPENFTDSENQEIDSDYYRFDQGGEYSNSPKGRESDFISDKEQFEDDTFETNPDGWDWNSPETFEAFREWREDRDIRRGEEFDRRMADQETMPPGEYDRLLGERERFGMRSERRSVPGLIQTYGPAPEADKENSPGLRRMDEAYGGYANWDDDNAELFARAEEVLKGALSDPAERRDFGRAARQISEDRSLLSDLTPEDRQMVIDTLNRATSMMRPVPDGYEPDTESILRRFGMRPNQLDDDSAKLFALAFEIDDLRRPIASPEEERMLRDRVYLMERNSSVLSDLDRIDRSWVMNTMRRAADKSRRSRERFEQAMRNMRAAGLESRRQDKPNNVRRNEIAMDMTMDEIATFDDELAELQSVLNDANEPELSRSVQNFRDAIQNSSDANDMLVVDRADAENVSDMLNYLAEQEKDFGPGPREMNLVANMLAEGLEADRAGQMLVSTALDDQGTRLSMGPDQVRPASVGDRLRSAFRDKPRHRGFRSSREVDDMNIDELGREQEQLRQTLNGVRDAISGTASVSGISVDDVMRDPSLRDRWASFFDDPDLALESLDDYIRINDQWKDIQVRRGAKLRLQADERRSRAMRQNRNRWRGLSQVTTLDEKDSEPVADFLYNFDYENIDENPGFLGGGSAGYSGPGDSRRRSGWGARMANDEEVYRGEIDEGPLDGWSWEYAREETYSLASFSGPGESFGGSHGILMTSPDGKTRIYLESGLEDEPELTHITSDFGDGPSRRRVDALEKLIDLQDDPDPDLEQGFESARRMMNLAENGGAYPGMFTSVSEHRRIMGNLEDRIEDGSVDLDPDDRDEMLNLLRFAQDKAVGMMSKRSKGKKAKKAPGAGQSNQASEDSPNVAKLPRQMTDNSSLLGTQELGGKSQIPARVANSARPAYQVLARNGFTFRKSGKEYDVILPDRLIAWTREVSKDPRKMQEYGWQTQMKGGVLPRPGVGINKRTTGINAQGKEINPLKRWINTIFGPTAWDDLERNAKNKGRGKVGRVPSTDRTGEGMRSVRNFGSARTPGRPAGESQRDRFRSAQDEIAANRSLGGGLRSRRRRGTAGVSKVSDSDGQAWQNLTPEARELVQAGAMAREGQLFYELVNGKGSPLRPARANMFDDGLWDTNMTAAQQRKIPPAANDRALLVSMQSLLDRAGLDGLISEEKQAELQKKLDDLKTLQRMRQKGDFSKLEHLHDDTQRSIWQRAKKGNAGKVPSLASLGLDGSTFHTRDVLGAVQRKRKRSANRQGKRRIPLTDRFLRPDPQREARRAARRARRRTGRGGGFTVEQTQAGRIERARRTAGRFRRRLRARLTGGVTERKVTSRVDEIGNAKKIRTDGDKVIFAPDFTEAFAKMQKILDKDPEALKEVKLKNRDGERSVGQNKVMGSLWDSLGFNDKPIAVTEEELANLMELGHRVILRGHGTSANAQGYIDDPLRYLPGFGGSAYGYGEYWSMPVDGANFDTWLMGSGTPVTVGVLPKNAQIIEMVDLQKEMPSFEEVVKAIAVTETNFPGGMDKSPVDDVGRMARSEFDKLSDAVKASRIGQLTDQMIKKLEEGDANALAGLAVLKQISTNGFTSDHTRNYLGMVLGYDAAIQTGKGDLPRGPAVVFSRSSVTVADKAIGRERWQQWQKDAKAVAQGLAPDKKPDPSDQKLKFGNSKVTPTWSQISKMDKVVGPLGSQGGQWYKDKNGKRYFTKPGRTHAHAANETAVAAIYRTAGVGAPSAVMTGDNAVGTVVIEGLDVDTTFSMTKDLQAKIKKNMGLDMLLSNWDVGQAGNIGIDKKSGEMIRLDAGGGGQFRAQGGPKPSFATGQEWQEPASMITSPFGQRLYGTVTNGDMAAAMEQVANLDLGSLDAAMKASGVDPGTRKVFRDVIQERQREAVRLQGLFAAADLSAAVSTTGSGPGSTVKPG